MMTIMTCQVISQYKSMSMNIDYHIGYKETRTLVLLLLRSFLEIPIEN